MKYKSIIFDLDGTLADTSDDLSAAINLMLESYGFGRKSKQAIMEHINYGARAFVSGCLPDERKNDSVFLDEALKRYMKFYEAHCLDKTRLYDGIKELVRSLYENGVKMCVLSNKQDDMTKKIVMSLLNQEQFAEIIGVSQKFPHKPNPDSSIYLANRMGIKLCEVIFIGDSDVDMATAANAGMFSLGVTWGYRAESVLAEAGAMRIVRTPGEILNFILD